jgi:YQGE family putative transporter
LGKEGTLGLAQSAAALISSVGLYILARKIRPNQRVTVLFRSIVGLTVLTLVFVGVFQREVAFIYIVLISTFAHLNWLARNPIANKAIEDQEGGDSTNNYAYVCDREILLNTGRIIGVMLFFGLNWSLGEQTALRLALLVAVGCQLALVVTVKKLTKLLT